MSTATCVWTNDAQLDEFWNTAPRTVICTCPRCYDSERDQPRDMDCIWDFADEEFKTVYGLLVEWIDPTIHISNFDEGEQVASVFESYVRANHLLVYRVVGRDSGIFNSALMYWWEFRE